jgi:hypothetical protein
MIRFRLEERDRANNRDWSEFASFEVENPKPAQIEPWKTEMLPRVMLTNGLEVEIGELSVRHEPIHPTDIWEDIAFLPVRFRSAGQLATNWGLTGGMVWDASGNHDAFSYTFGVVSTNDWKLYRMFRVLDPAKAWRFRLHYSRLSEFPADNLFTFTVPWPMSGPMLKDIGGFSAEVEFRNQTMLVVKLADEPRQKRISFVSAVDEESNRVDSPVGSWGQHQFGQVLNLSKPAKVRVTVAIHDDFETEFTLQPKWEKPANALKPNSPP